MFRKADGHQIINPNSNKNVKYQSTKMRKHLVLQMVKTVGRELVGNPAPSDWTEASSENPSYVGLLASRAHSWWEGGSWYTFWIYQVSFRKRMGQYLKVIPNGKPISHGSWKTRSERKIVRYSVTSPTPFCVMVKIETISKE